MEDSLLKEKLDRKNREIQILKEISAKINSSLDLNHTLNTFLKLLDKYFTYRHSMILLVDPDNIFLTVFSSYGYLESGIGAKVRIGKGIIGTVAKRKKMMNIGNINTKITYMKPGGDIYYHPENEIIIKLPGLAYPKSQVALPLLVNEELVGVLSIESDELRIYKEEDEEIILVIANQAALAIQKARLYEDEKKRSREIHEMNERLSALYADQKRTLNLFVKYVPEPIVKKALRENPESIFEGELINVALLFCDIRDFTKVSEKLSPRDVVYLLNSYYKHMAVIIKKYEGSVNQFVGDEIFVTFGAPVSINECPQKAVLCAIEMIDSLTEINEDLSKSLKINLTIGIGINYGPVVAGNVGSEDRIEYHVTGDTVNTGKRIESLTSDHPNTILISENIYSETSHFLETKSWEPILVKGKSKKISVYQVLGKLD